MDPEPDERYVGCRVYVCVYLCSRLWCVRVCDCAGMTGMSSPARYAIIPLTPKPASPVLLLSAESVVDFIFGFTPVRADCARKSIFTRSLQGDCAVAQIQEEQRAVRELLLRSSFIYFFSPT